MPCKKRCVYVESLCELSCKTNTKGTWQQFLDLVDTVKFEHSESTDRNMLIPNELSVECFTIQLLQKIKALTTRHFIAKQQSKFCSELKTNLPNYVILLQGDFRKIIPWFRKFPIRDHFLILHLRLHCIHSLPIVKSGEKLPKPDFNELKKKIMFITESGMLEKFWAEMKKKLK